MLKFDPAKRITVEEALEHPYMKDLHFEEDEPVAEQVLAFDFDFELYDLDKEDYKRLVYEEIMLYHDGDLYDQYELEK
jgi:mitogen-activated protein kinase 1/3